MAISLNQAIQQKLNRLAGVEKVVAALLVMHPGAGAEDFRYLASGADPEIWNVILPISNRYKTDRKSALLNETIVCSGNSLQLLAASYRDPARDPYLIAATLPLPEAFDLSSMRNALEKIARACIQEADSIRWR